ncbi:MAG: 4-alpha-glucanotransferase, partial [Erysipelotrichaceae bacterium]|nr:4-alpha-glucanotransferase [Erysipelotrichaceae bacterium]
HDNESLRVWYSHCDEQYKRQIRRYFKRHQLNNRLMSENMIEYTLRSVSKIAIIPMVDLLNKNDSCRINFPGTVGDPNWQWKMKDYDEFKSKMKWIKEKISISNR